MLALAPSNKDTRRLSTYEAAPTTTDSTMSSTLPTAEKVNFDADFGNMDETESDQVPSSKSTPSSSAASRRSRAYRRSMSTTANETASISHKASPVSLSLNSKSEHVSSSSGAEKTTKKKLKTASSSNNLLVADSSHKHPTKSSKSSKLKKSKSTASPKSSSCKPLRRSQTHDHNKPAALTSKEEEETPTSTSSGTGTTADETTTTSSSPKKSTESGLRKSKSFGGKLDDLVAVKESKQTMSSASEREQRPGLSSKRTSSRRVGLGGTSHHDKTPKLRKKSSKNGTTAGSSGNNRLYTDELAAPSVQQDTEGLDSSKVSSASGNKENKVQKDSKDKGDKSLVASSTHSHGGKQRRPKALKKSSSSKGLAGLLDGSTKSGATSSAGRPTLTRCNSLDSKLDSKKDEGESDSKKEIDKAAHESLVASSTHSHGGKQQQHKTLKKTSSSKGLASLLDWSTKSGATATARPSLARSNSLDSKLDSKENGKAVDEPLVASSTHNRGGKQRSKKGKGALDSKKEKDKAIDESMGASSTHGHGGKQRRPKTLKKSSSSKGLASLLDGSTKSGATATAARPTLTRSNSLDSKLESLAGDEKEDLSSSKASSSSRKKNATYNETSLDAKSEHRPSTLYNMRQSSRKSMAIGNSSNQRASSRRNLLAAVAANKVGVSHDEEDATGTSPTPMGSCRDLLAAKRAERASSRRNLMPGTGDAQLEGTTTSTSVLGSRRNVFSARRENSRRALLVVGDKEGSKRDLHNRRERLRSRRTSLLGNLAGEEEDESIEVAAITGGPLKRSNTVDSKAMAANDTTEGGLKRFNTMDSPRDTDPSSHDTTEEAVAVKDVKAAPIRPGRRAGPRRHTSAVDPALKMLMERNAKEEEAIQQRLEVQNKKVLNIRETISALAKEKNHFTETMTSKMAMLSRVPGTTPVTAPSTASSVRLSASTSTPSLHLLGAITSLGKPSLGPSAAAGNANFDGVASTAVTNNELALGSTSITDMAKRMKNLGANFRLSKHKLGAAEASTGQRKSSTPEHLTGEIPLLMSVTANN